MHDALTQRSGPGNSARAFAAKDVATIERLLDDKAVYHNVGMEPAVGKDASMASIKRFIDMSESMAFEIHHLAVLQATSCSPSAPTR